MTGSQLRPDWAANALADNESVLFGQGVHRWVVGFSGGVDSTVLLHWLSHLSNRLPILALHVNHQLDPDAPFGQRQPLISARRSGSIIRWCRLT